MEISADVVEQKHLYTTNGKILLKSPVQWEGSIANSQTTVGVIYSYWLS